MESEKTPAQPKHEHREKDLETTRAWSAPRHRAISTNTTKSQAGSGDDGGNDELSAS